jgi:hypothetical protein
MLKMLPNLCQWSFGCIRSIIRMVPTKGMEFKVRPFIIGWLRPVMLFFISINVVLVIACLKGLNPFTSQYPNWSKFGRMVYDVQCALDFITEGRGVAAGEMPELDLGHIVLLGYSLGGMVALHAGALDDRVTGMASFCGFTPFRSDKDEKNTGGIRRWWEWHGLLPKLGLFHGREEKIPYDFDGLLKSSSSKPTLIYSALRDRGANASEVEACVNRAGKGSINFIQADDVNRFQSSQHQVLIDWLTSMR